MEHLNKIKSVATAIFAVVSGWLGVLAIPVYILLLLNVTDYITGLCAAKYRGQAINSNRGLQGILKKACMWIIVGLGAAVDVLIEFATNSIGIHLPVAFLFASIVAIWLICNEIISILENIADIGEKVPPFLLNIAKKLKGLAEEKAGIDKEEQ